MPTVVIVWHPHCLHPGRRVGTFKSTDEARQAVRREGYDWDQCHGLSVTEEFARIKGKLD
jgi:hypothetical protein